MVFNEDTIYAQTENGRRDMNTTATEKSKTATRRGRGTAPLDRPEEASCVAPSLW